MIIREIRLKDVQTMMKWGTFEDPRYFHFNFPYSTKEEFQLWYEYKVKGFRLRTYGVFIEDDLIGFISFKKINYFFSRAELGVIFDKNHISEGYGTEALRQCMEKINLKKIYLFVSSFNKRAYHVYEKLGFVDKGVVYRVFETQDAMDQFTIDGDEFFLRNGKLYGKYYKMEININKTAHR